VRPVPPGSTVVGVPGRVVEDTRQPVIDLEHGKLPDPVSEAIMDICDRHDNLTERVRQLEELLGAGRALRQPRPGSRESDGRRTDD
jgi:serine O-acetyltransferase